jgi:CO/xanthine dehydrogenase Mo-binding subunit
MATTTTDRELKVVGTRPIRPDGVDKVTGRANFGADMKLPRMLWGKIKRSPHAHARILGINTEKALALPGVHAVVTSADFPVIPPEEAFVGEGPMNFRDLSRNVMAPTRYCTKAMRSLRSAQSLRSSPGKRST